jgi:hypothetical protein
MTRFLYYLVYETQWDVFFHYYTGNYCSHYSQMDKSFKESTSFVSETIILTPAPCSLSLNAKLSTAERGMSSVTGVVRSKTRRSALMRDLRNWLVQSGRNHRWLCSDAPTSAFHVQLGSV